MCLLRRWCVKMCQTPMRVYLWFKISLNLLKIRNSSPAYTIEIDETTTARHWRQLSVLVRCYSEELKRTVVSHFSAITLGKVQSFVLASKIADIVTSLYPRQLLQVSSDGPNLSNPESRHCENWYLLHSINLAMMLNALLTKCSNFSNILQNAKIS